MKTFAVSTCAFRKKNVEAVDELAVTHGFTMEFSSGFPFEPGLDKKFLSARCTRLIHNYFPTPETPFVLNLASLNPVIREKSVEHCRQAIRLARQVGSPFYSVHAGFCVDPDAKDLGKTFQFGTHIPREAHWEAFIGALRMLVQEAEQQGVDLLVENNVTIASNIGPDGIPPLLCTAPEETGRMLKEISSSRFGMLLDIGHLKVSALSIGFDPEAFIRTVQTKLKAIHHNDNDGLVDNNKPCGPSYWFLPYMPLFKSATHILEVLDQTPEEVLAQRRLLEEAAAK
jgi:sugar phosphate isomerase/epimerase